MDAFPTRELLEKHERDGYFTLRDVLSGEDVAAVRGAIHEAIEAPEEKRKGHYDQELIARQGGRIDERAKFRKLGQFAREHREVFFRGVAHENVLKVMRHFLGEDLVMVYDSVFLKLARTGGATPWHQDIGLWPEKMDESFNFWIAIDPATRANGCLQFVPGSHRGPIVEHKLYENAVHKELPREMTADLQTDFVELFPGDGVFWHSNAWHYSGPNTSPQDRIAIAGVYLTPDCAQRSPKAQGSMAWVMRGGVRCPWPLEKYSHTSSAPQITY